MVRSRRWSWRGLGGGHGAGSRRIKFCARAVGAHDGHERRERLLPSQGRFRAMTDLNCACSYSDFRSFARSHQSLAALQIWPGVPN